MAKNKRKRTHAQKAARARCKAEFMTIFVAGKQKRVRRPPSIDGLDPDEFICRNADPIWLHQNEMWEYMEPEPVDNDTEPVVKPRTRAQDALNVHEPQEIDGEPVVKRPGDDIPF
ncbi:hypothetical protein TVNIR_0797 [Thioalkalivibrio nitratireducens DSM 14787]|uniref:Uncharacterized protein n=1 Tax=Thioalkalivibrio nitratireducens (strain DSM 14787 / UNIQEM 213 / ALEN2) TaxID=1255043 RepID=L0DU01_THIND|nr:hypothetical protein [Thioalkalivibrio nitratireducens]AGA32487.1 hypothetical protein TVNIR_0797 [Thioalkalivibrio nitratireducens DSM 14787]